MNLSRFSTPAGVKNCGEISVNFRNGRARRRVEGAGFRLGEYNDVSEINSFIQKVISGVQVSDDLRLDHRQKQTLQTNYVPTTPTTLNHPRQRFHSMRNHSRATYKRCTYKRLKHTAVSDGDHLGTHNNITRTRCELVCDQTFRCQSFGYCPWYEGGSCFMFDKKIKTNEPQNTSRTDCYTNFKIC